MRKRQAVTFVTLLLLGFLLGCGGRSSDAPVAVARADRAVVAVGDVVMLDGSASRDPSGRTLSFTWHFTARPSASTAVLAEADTATPRFVTDRPGTYVVRMIVSNGVREAEATVSITAGASDGQVLEPGGSVDGPDGVRLMAMPEALTTSVTVQIDRVPDHDVTQPLPDGLERVGHVYRVAADADTLAADAVGFGFLLALPPDAAGRHDIDVAFYLRAETVGSWYPQYAGEHDVWEIVPGEYDGDLDRWVVSLHALPREGIEIGLAAGGYFADPGPSSTAVDRAGDVEFHVRCRKSDDPSICGPVPTQAYAAAMAEAYTTFTELGFAHPMIRTRYRFGLGPPTVYLFAFTWDDDGTRKCNWSTAPAYYNPVTANVVVCLCLAGFTAQRESTTWHEYFHATQFGYALLLEPVIQRHWILEGTARAAESVLTLLRAGGDPASTPVDRRDDAMLRAVDVGLREHGEGVEYAVQDFWVFLGKWHERPIDWLHSVFVFGLSRSAVNAAIRYEFDGLTLSEAYWAWVKNQAFEKSVDLGGTVFTQRARCAFDERTASPVELTFDPTFDGATWRFALPYLTSAVLAFDLEPLATHDYGTTLNVEAERSGVVSKYYEPAEAGFFGCHFRDDASTHDVVVARGETARVYLLVSNTRISGLPTEIVVRAERAETFELSISEPVAGAVIDEGPIEFVAGLHGPWLDGHTAIVRWYDEAGARLGTGERVETTRVCPGERTITATAEVPELGASAEASLTMHVTKRPPRVSLTTDPLPDAVGAGAFLALNGWAHENYCGEPPTQPARLLWRDGDGRLLGSGPGLLAQVPWDASGGTFDVVLEYTDEYDLRASDAVTMTVTEPPPGGYSPTVVIDAPRTGTFFWRGEDDVIVLRGRAADPEDGVLSGTALTWSVRDRHGEWVEVGHGQELSYVFSVAGDHEFRLVATDSDGNTGEAIVRVFYVWLG